MTFHSIGTDTFGYICLARFNPRFFLFLFKVFALADREALLQAVDVAFAVPGDTIKDALYERIARSYQVEREEIPDKLETFHLALENLLGTSAPVMERLIAKDFYSRLKLDFLQHNGWTLIDYVDHAKRVKRYD